MSNGKGTRGGDAARSEDAAQVAWRHVLRGFADALAVEGLAASDRECLLTAYARAAWLGGEAEE